jgi:bifunctional DNase/RNase
MNTTPGRIAALALLLGCSVALVAASRRAEAPASAQPAPASLQEVDVLAVLANPQTGAPLVLLQGKRDGRAFAMAIGPAEATGIALPLAGRTPPRPLTHDLFATLFGRLNVTVTKAVITDLRDDVYYANLYLNAAGAEHVLDTRPSDAIALAIRAKAPVLVEERVLERAEIIAPAPTAPGGPRI